MMFRESVAAALIMVLGTSVAQAEPPFPTVTDGFAGTPFRGVALGQSRAQVESALAANGFRCLTDEEYSNGPIIGSGYTVCPIARADFVLDNITQFEILARRDLTQKLGIPYYAVSFVDDVASAITLETGYFNADGTTPYLFAKQIIDNYGVTNGMMPYGSGWRGATVNDEDLLVQTLYNGQIAILVVMASTGRSTPTFD